MKLKGADDNAQKTKNGTLHKTFVTPIASELSIILRTEGM